jgi:hypothetical protein
VIIGFVFFQKVFDVQFARRLSSRQWSPNLATGVAVVVSVDSDQSRLVFELSVDDNLLTTFRTDTPLYKARKLLASKTIF